MTTRLARTVAAVLAATCALVLTAGCGSAPAQADSASHRRTAVATPEVDVPQTSPQEAALDAYVAAAQSQIPALLDSFDGTYSQITISGEHPDLIEFRYVYAQPVDPAAATELFDGMLDSFQSTLDDQVFPDMERAGITGSQRARYTYVNTDGTTIWTHTFESA